jgi:oligosaccharide reducing-end xylanase
MFSLVGRILRHLLKDELAIAALVVLAGHSLWAEPPRPPPNYAAPQYDEDKVGKSYDGQQVLNFAGRELGQAGAQSQVKASGAFATGHYRNLFVEAGHSPQEVSAKVNAAFQQLFHGDPAVRAVYFPAGTNASGAMAYIYDLGSKDVRSEGMSYGMIIAVQLNKKAEFDALWNWSKSYMYHTSPKHPACGYFAWSMATNGGPNDEMPAPDGEEYFVTALYFASGRWGNGSGICNYRAEADRLLLDMRHRQLITGPTVKGIMTAGAVFEANYKMVRFTPDIVNWNHTDCSYHLPAFYELWVRWGPQADRAFWAEAAKASRDFFQRTTHPDTGLAPDYANFDGTPWAAPWNPHSADFQYDSWRTAMNWSVDWAWWAKDVGEPQLSDRLQTFFESKGISSYGNRFKLDGTQFGNDHSTGLVAMNAVASLAATQPRARRFVEALWEAPVPFGQGRYYDGMLYLLAMLYCGGEFRVWPPQ